MNFHPAHRVPLVIVLLALALAAPIAAWSAQPSGVSISTENPRYWQLDGKPVLLLGGSTGPIPHRATATPGLENDEGMFLWPDAIEALETLAAAGGNYVRCLMSGRVRGEPLWPFDRTGGTYDLDQWDQHYWKRFETFLRRARELGIVVQIEIWATFDYGRAPWALNPFNPQSNINYTAESSGLPVADDVPHSQNSFYRSIPESDDVPVVLGYQERFVDKILEHTLRHDHVLYCIDNETRQSPAWGAYWCRHVRAAAAKAGRKAFITEMYGSHDLRDPIHNSVVDHPELYDFVEAAQNNHQPGQSHYDALLSVRERIQTAPRPMNNVKIYGVDGGRFGTSKDAMERFWRNIFAGCASARFHEKHLGGSEPALRTIRSAREVFAEFDVFRSSPRNDLLSDREPNEAYCLADPGTEYAVYLPAGGSVRLDAGAAQGMLTMKWFDIDAGQWASARQVDAGNLVLDAPDPGQWIALVGAMNPASPALGAPAGLVIRERRERPDMLDADSPPGLRVVQITTDTSRPSHNVYTEAHVFTPDSKRFVFYRGSDLWVCDLSDDFSLRQLTDEPDVVGPSVSPDGEWMYYLAETARPLKALVLKRVSLATCERESFMTITDRVEGQDRLPYGVYGLSSISSDGKRLCFGAFFSDGMTENAPWGLLVFDLEERSARAIPLGPEFINPHPQYSRSRDPVHHRDILVQHNQGGGTDPKGVWRNRRGPGGCILHVIRDDGSHWRHVPLGLVLGEPLNGHEQWRGGFPTVIAAASWGPGLGGRLFEAVPIAADRESQHRGIATPRGRHTDLSAAIAEPRFWHFSVDDAGMHVVSDWLELDAQETRRVSLVVGTLSSDVNPSIKMRYLLNTRTSAKDQPEHPHPFFSPDAKMAFFNSDADGVPQVWMVTGFTFPE